MIHLVCYIFLNFFFLFTSHETVYIQPLGNVQDNHIWVVQKSLTSVYGFKCVVFPAVPHSKKLYANSKTRYDANKILHHFASGKRLLVITEKDIAHHKSSRFPEWGIFGLGSPANKTCVVSTYRLGPAAKLNQRLAKVAVHEIGHTLGLTHCTKSKLCVMQGAKGAIKTVDNESIQLCSVCSLFLNRKSKIVF